MHLILHESGGSDRFVMKRFSKISPLLFVVCALSFLLPFVTVHAGGNAVGSFSGARVATGVTVNAPQVGEDAQAGKFEADPMAVFALVCILLCFLMSFVATQGLALFPALGGLIGAGALFALKYSFASQVSKQTSGAMQVSYLPGYYAALGCLIAAALWNVYQSLLRRSIPEEDLVPRAAFAEAPTYRDIAFPTAMPAEPVANRGEPPVLAPRREAPAPIVVAATPQAPPAVQNKATVPCAECGALMPGRLNYCTVCGNPMGAFIPSVPKADWQPVSPETPVNEPVAAPIEEPARTNNLAVEPAVQPSAGETCAHCGADLPGDVNFCIACGHPVKESASVIAAQPVAPLILARVPELPASEPLPELPASEPEVLEPEVVLEEPSPAMREKGDITCSQCGATLPHGSKFCNICGNAVGASAMLRPTTPQAIPLQESSVPVPPTMALPPPEPTRRYTILPEIGKENETPSMLPEPAAAMSSWETAQPLRKEVRVSRRKPWGVIIIALLAIVLLAGAATTWYYWGVNTVIVCSPYDAKVFLDGEELSPDTPGRFSVDHLPRGPHTLKVQRDGYSDSFMNLDFPMTSASEWVNVRLTPVSNAKNGPEGKARNTRQPASHVR
jgi:hypothetical protein